MPGSRSSVMSGTPGAADRPLGAARVSPYSITRARLSSLVNRDGFISAARADGHPDLQGNGIGDKPYRAVSEEKIDTSRMVAACCLVSLIQAHRACAIPADAVRQHGMGVETRPWHGSA